jgi:ribosomal protein S18 acetylase RimI-like enzyme
VAGPATRVNVRRVTPDDAWQAAGILSRSHADFPAFRHTYPDPRQRDRRITAAMSAMAREVTRRGEGYLARVRGLVVGAALWFAPESPSRDGWDRVRWAATMLPEALVGRRRYREFAAVGSALAREAATEDGWYLHALGVDPRQQGRGIGSRLMAPALEAADARGLTCALHTSDPANVGFFVRFGFVVVDPLHPVVPGGPAYLRMRRHPR